MSYMTKASIRSRPFPRDHAKNLAAIVTWIRDVAPCIVAPYEQSADVTYYIVTHLAFHGVSDQDIATGLMASGYEFNFLYGYTHHIAFIIEGRKMRIEEQKRERRNEQLKTQKVWGSQAPFDIEKFKQEAASLDVKFQVAMNAGDSVAMQSLAEALLALLMKAQGAADQMLKDRQRIKDVQAEILRNSPNIARTIQPVGPREPPVPGPDGRVPRYRFTPPRVPPRAPRK